MGAVLSSSGYTRGAEQLGVEGPVVAQRIVFGGADVGGRQAGEIGGVGRSHGDRQRGRVADVGVWQVPGEEGVDDVAVQNRRVGVLDERRQRLVSGDCRIPQQLECQLGSALISMVAGQMSHHRGEVAAGRITGDGNPVRVAA